MDKEDAEAVAAYEKRKGTKQGIAKAPFVLTSECWWRRCRGRLPTACSCGPARFFTAALIYF